MRRTYAYNSIVFGFLLGTIVWLSANSPVLGILVGIAVSVVGFIVIRLIENAIDKGVDKAADSISKAYRSHKAKKAYENGAPVSQAPARPVTQFPGREQPRHVADDTPRLVMRHAAAYDAHAPQAPAYHTAQVPTREQTRRIMEDIRPQRTFSDPYAPAPVSHCCPYCGEQADSDACFCTVCGSALK